ncbi:hypothetical protein ABPG72_019094 [Tetrahymena utriculariae]
MKIEAEPILNLKRDGATSTLLILDEEIYILLDCGLNSSMDFTAYWQNIEKLKKVDMILLSHVGAEFVGALPFLLNNKQIMSQGKNIRIYSTTPVMKLGMFNSYNQYLNTMMLASEEETLVTEKSFQKFYIAYDRCKVIQFFQKKVVHIKHNDIIISPNCIGNTLGACAWIIKDNLINIMYMIQFNHISDEHLDGINIKTFVKKRIDVLITEQTLLNGPISSEFPSSTPLYLTNKKSNNALKDTLKQAIQKTAEQFASLVIVSYPNERVIEIIMILWQIWNESKKIFKIPQQEDQYAKIEFYHNYKKYLQDLVNDQIKCMKKETADILVNSNPLQPESNFINLENIFAPQQPGQPFRGPKIIVTTQCCLYYPQMLNYIKSMANSDKNTLLFIGKKSTSNRYKWLKQGLTGLIKEDQLLLSELSKTVIKQFLFEEEEQVQSQLNYQQSGMPIEDNFDNETVATAMDNHIEDLDDKSNIGKDLFDNEEEEQEQLFEYKQKDYYRFLYKTTKYKKGDYGEELTEEELELLKTITNKKKKKDMLANRTYITPEQIATQVFDLVENTIIQNYKLIPFMFNSCMNIQEFNIDSVSDDRSISNIFTLLNPKRIFYINQGANQVQELLREETDIHNKSLDIFNFQSKIKINSKVQGRRFVGKITMNYNEGSQNKVNLTLEQEMNNSNPNREYYGDYPLEKLLEYLQKSGYTFTVAWGGINYEDKVIIKKEDQNFSVEGIRCKEYYEIRKLVYDFLQSF